MNRVFYSLTVVIIVTLLTLHFVKAEGVEYIGNEPVFNTSDPFHAMINNKSRVYYRDVNGDELAFFKSTTKQLNETLKKFAETNAKVHELVLRPGPASVETFTQTQSIKYNWSLNRSGGIAAHLSTLDQGSNIWNKNPVLTIYVDEEINLDSLVIPKNVSILELADLKKRYSKCLNSNNLTVRGWSTGELAKLDVYDDENMKAISQLLRDKEQWVRLNAARALHQYGKLAEPLLPLLKKAAKSDDNDEQVKARLKSTIKKIENATDTTAALQAHQLASQKIHQFRIASPNHKSK